MVIDVFTGHRLQQDAFRQAHATFFEKASGGGDLASGDATKIAERALDFGDAVLPQLLLQLLKGVIHESLVGLDIYSLTPVGRALCDHRALGAEHQAGFGEYPNLVTLITAGTEPSSAPSALT
ncbi:hypothetical protein KAM380_030970 [Aeromonas caviae]|nr:hypothetical protein KAM380_030970 [Aeromonas caviae]